MTAAGTSVDTGTVLDRRWVIGERIGIGSSSRVYVARDLRLDITVAVKVLHESLATDPAFLAQFNAEAAAVSVLDHDHIVRFYDAGTHDVGGLEVPFIVTAFLRGGSLASLLAAGRRLDAAQAVSVGRDAAAALAVAHLADLVHRDVKPANLLFDESGRLGLADFGIARAIAAAASTEPFGSGAGTTRYASPEQMQGRPLDGRSDVYSLGLVLIESVTGMVPLLADTLAGTIAMRAERDIDVSSDFGALREPLLAATAVDRDRRCSSAELVTMLDAAAVRAGDPAPLPLAPVELVNEDTSELRMGAAAAGGLTVLGALRGEPDERGEPGGGDDAHHPEQVADRDDDSGAPDAEEGEEDSDSLVIDLSDSATDAESPGAWSPGERGPIEVAKENAALVASVPSRLGPVPPLEAAAAPGSVASKDMGAGRRPRRTRRTVLLVALLVLLVAASGAAAWWFAIRVPTHEVPAWVGGDISAVVESAEQNGWELIEAEPQRSDGTTPGEVLSQDPEPGTVLAEGESVTVTASLGNTLTEVPGLGGLPEGEAVAALDAAGLELGERLSEFNEETEAGIVMLWAPAEGSDAEADGRVPKGTAIDIVVSDGPAPRVVPGGLEGMALADATAALEALQLGVDATEEYSDDVPEGVVLRTGTPGGTEVARGTAIAVVVSAGPEPIVVPDVTGSTGAAAAATLEAAGFEVSGIEGSPSGTVLATDPVAGESRQPGSPVRIFTRQ